ncbi:SulP family inorganic anion transporter [Desulfococcus sp.]|uniref:SulP family inorganic anion transporter n=1 Tax=Desulfococcus sp. TaxID=2025834 RepID=UPI003594215E
MSAADKFQWPKMFSGLQGFTWGNLPREISAGITLAALIIPLNIGYAQVAGLPPVLGLYAGIIPLAVFAIFTSSRHLVGSPDAASSAIVGAILISFAPVGDPLRLQYALALALVCGLLFFVFWFFRLAFLANFLSRAVLAGFITGLGIEVLTNQVRKILGAVHGGGSGLEAIAQQLHDAMATSIDTTGYFVELIALIESIPHANLYSVAIGLGAFVIVRLMKKYSPKTPAALITLILTTVIVAVLGLDQKGVRVLGAMPSGLPSLTLPNVPLTDYLRLLPGAMAVVGITLCEGLLLVRSCSRKHNTKADGDQVLFAFGMSSIASGFTGSLVMGNSASRTAAMEAAGSRTQLSSLVAAAAVALVMVFFTDKLAYLPTAALAGVVANAVLNLIEVKELRELWQMRRSEFWVAAVCLLSVLVFGPLQAVIIAFLMATIDLLRRASRPGTWTLREAPDGSHFVPEETDHAPEPSGIIIYRFAAPLYFANATLFEEEVEKLITQAATPVKWFVLDAEAMVDIDTTGEQTLHQVLKWLAKRGVTVALSRANQPTSALLKHYQLLELIGENRLYPTNRHAIEAFRRETGETGAE